MCPTDRLNPRSVPLHLRGSARVPRGNARGGDTGGGAGAHGGHRGPTEVLADPRLKLLKAPIVSNFDCGK